MDRVDHYFTRSFLCCFAACLLANDPARLGRRGTDHGRAIALNCLPKHEVSEILVIPTGLKTFVLNPEFGAGVLP